MRPYQKRDFQALVQLQTDSFHTPLPLPIEQLDRIAKLAMRAEVSPSKLIGSKKADPGYQNICIQQKLCPYLPDVQVMDGLRHKERQASRSPETFVMLVAVSEKGGLDSGDALKTRK